MRTKIILALLAFAGNLVMFYLGPFKTMSVVGMSVAVASLIILFCQKEEWKE